MFLASAGGPPLSGSAPPCLALLRVTVAVDSNGQTVQPPDSDRDGRPQLPYPGSQGSESTSVVLPCKTIVNRSVILARE